ncbi:MAG TPA: IclR family transcriptional regulator C-terminal domain-containing protein [Burkholderiaceae bacterium]|nr:IclR family transcriptional regulator C-terminal domain-containing protein [Burkholderiaceae bacterium]
MPADLPPAARSERHRRTLTISRAALVLRELAARADSGWRLTDLALSVGMDKATVHRVLRALIAERLAQQRPDSRRYLPGPLLYELGLSVQSPERLRQASQPALARIARRGRGVAFLYLRSGDEFVCASRIGSLRARVLTVEPGTRRALVTSAGGAAILAALPAHEADPIVQRNLRSIAHFGRARIDGIRRMLSRSFDRGAGVNLEDVVAGVNAFGVALRDAERTVIGALVLSSPAELCPPQRLDEILALLQREASQLEESTRSPEPVRTDTDPA